MTVIGRQLVLPAAVSVAVGDRVLNRFGKIARRIGVDLLALQVPATVIRIGDRLIEPLIVFPDQLVQLIIMIGRFQRRALL